MPVEGPVSRRLRATAQGTLRDALKERVDKGLAHLDEGAALLGDVLPAVGLEGGDAEALRTGVHDLFDSLWTGFEVPPQSSPAALALKDAARSFTDASLTPDERRKKLAAAAGDPLTDAVLEVVVDLARIVPAGALKKGATALSKTMGDASVQQNVEAKWYATFVPSADGVASVGDNLEKLRARLQTPEFRDELARALDVVRVLGRLEAHNLEKIALDVDAAGAGTVKDAVSRYLTTVAEGAIVSSLPKDGELAVLARDLVSLAAVRRRAADGDAAAGDGDLFRAVVERLAGGSGDVTRSATNDAAAALAETERSARALPETLDAAEERLLSDLRGTGALSEEAAGAVKELCADMSAVLVTAAHLFRLFGAAKNDKIPEEQRIPLVKNAAKDAGPVVVKLLQTFANQAAADGGAVDGVTHRALLELQERVPEMSEAEVRAQVEAGLGTTIDEAFVPGSFEMKPLASASIGQAHRARVKDCFGREHEVVVKVQRPHLAEQFTRATRVTRIGLQFASELMRVLGDQGKKLDLPEGVDPLKMMKLVEETVSSFVQSFEVETDFDKERVNLKKFRRDMRAHGHVTAPYVFRRWSSKTVITMELMRLEKVGSLIERAQLARATKATPAPTGPLAGDAVGDVTKRAVDHTARAFGIATGAERVTVERAPPPKDAKKPGGWLATVATDHPLYPALKLRIADDGVITHVQVPPILKDDDVRLMRDRFLASVLSQAVVHGRVHGDPHKGNWGVLADGQTIVMLDFGKMIDLKKKHLMAPLSLAWNWFRKDLDGMADAALTMSTVTDRGKAKEAKRALVGALSELQDTAPGKKPKRLEPDQIIGTVTATLASHGLGLSSVYTQSIKAGFSFAGNFSGLAEVGAGDLGLGSIARAGRIAGGDALDSATLGVVGSVIALRKNARVSALNKPPPS